MVLVGGAEGWFEGARRVIAGFFKWVELTNEGLITYRSPDYNQRGSVEHDQSALTDARELGKKLASLLGENNDRSET